MKRKIIFRGKLKDTGEWIYGDLLQTTKDTLILPINERWDQCVVNPDTIGQFTGLLDANGKEIYEGDILRCIGQRADNAGEIYYREVTFERGSFCIYCADMDMYSSIRNHIANGFLNWEVCGNIHDTTELLK